MRLASTIVLVLAVVVVLVAGASPDRALAAATVARGPSPGRALAVAVARGASPAPSPTVARSGVMRGQLSAGSLICNGAGWLNRIAGTVCKVATHPKTVITVGKKLLSGHPGGAVKAVLGGSSGAGRAVAATAGLAAVVLWVTGGAHAALQETAKLIGASSRPNLLSTWFSSAYWRVAAVSALLTLPFLFAAAIQALLRSDMTLLARAALGYLPLGMLAVGVAAPMTMLLLGASDEMSTIVSSASGNADGSFLAHAGVAAAAIGGAALSPFVAFFVALLTVAATITLWLELLIREAAVYVIVLMLPLFFAALVWPARRVWAARAVELLVALILSKFAIVAVLALGGAALDHAANLSVTSLLAGLTLVLLAAFSPWALLRLLPLHEMASAAAGGLRTASAQPLFNSDESGSMLASSVGEGGDALPRWLQQAARDRSRDDGSGWSNDVRASLPAPVGDHDGLLPQEHVQAAAEAAATAVAGTGGSVASPGHPPPTAPTATPENGTPPPGDGHLSAPWLRGMRPIWHSDWRDQEYPGEAGIDTPVAEVGEPPADPTPRPDTEPPTLPHPGADAPTVPHPDADAPTLPDPSPVPHAAQSDPEPRPPAARPDEDTR